MPEDVCGCGHVRFIHDEDACWAVEPCACPEFRAGAE